ncbi:hypothetical protein [Paraferrimonas sedimenticola]|uniref:Uncharacterized protein n=1 Tax=Paraferrimonas sedimenticola TaxID=375674 RepID=A0AA37RXV6_9GAMM|nr:hypothetical protein [Paraferrimonas sedimenticola]GLP96854.1 hypothetical protein GCM10007895_21600 [Paraferrimonas sedimenticola]
MENKTFYEHFKTSLDSMGLPAPNNLFSTVTTASSTIGTLAGIVKTYGTKVTIAEAVLAVPAGSGAAAITAQLAKVIGACTLAFYVGACLGALAYASGEWTSERLWANNAQGTADLLAVAKKHHIELDAELTSLLKFGSRTFLERSHYAAQAAGSSWHIA